MDRRQFLLAVPCGALLPSLALAQESGRVYRMAVISPSEAAVELIRNLMLPELARLGFVVGLSRRVPARHPPGQDHDARQPSATEGSMAAEPWPRKV
jgi:hypothetical protein